MKINNWIPFLNQKINILLLNYNNLAINVAKDESAAKKEILSTITLCSALSAWHSINTTNFFYVLINNWQGKYV